MGTGVMPAVLRNATLKLMAPAEIGYPRGVLVKGRPGVSVQGSACPLSRTYGSTTESKCLARGEGSVAVQA